MIKHLLLLMFIYSVCGFLFLLSSSSIDGSLSFVVGSLLMLINTAGLVWVWSLVFSKKSIALAVMVIIFKYGFLVWGIWVLSSVSWLKPLFFVIGLGSLLFATLVAFVFRLWRTHAF